ncbi:MAG: FG-GAP repeat protein, partial [Thermoplasmata archaeon]|nr:FG-GAP repeat protein [Thermoplasmata archaeon]
MWDILISIATGDINGDGIDDIIMGAYSANGPSNGRLSCGEAYIVYGNTTLPSEIDIVLQQEDVTIYGADSNDNAGSSVCAGDVNYDGFDDIIIGAPGGDGPGNMRDGYGEAYLIYGKSSINSTIDLVSQANMVIYSNSGPIGLFGASVASGDVNGDNYDDILICARQEGSIGAIYIIYCNASLPLTKDLQTEQADVKIIGDGGQAGSAITAGDLNGDLIDDIIVSAWQANGPGGTRNNCGEVYIINGSNSLPSTIDISLSQEDILIYGDESGDWAGHSLSVGKIDNDDAYDIVIGAQNAGGLNNGRPNSGEVYLIFSSGKMFELLKTEFIGLTNGDGVNNKICYSKYKPYNFRVKIIDPKGYTDLNTVTLSLDFKGENLKYMWSESDQQFSELINPNNYAELNATSSARNDGDKVWFIDFNITFNWSYPDNDFHGLQVYSTGDSGLYDWFNFSANVYQVENHVNFNGTVKVTGNYHGALNEDDWVRGGEQLYWDGLKIVYNGADTTYPPNDSGVIATLWDSSVNNWPDTPPSGENISIISIADLATKFNETYTINITGIRPQCDKSNITFKLSIDGDNVTFSNPLPGTEKWYSILNPKCGITISDPTTKVNTSSIQYRISTDNGTIWGDGWINANLQQSAVEEINCILQPAFKDGRDNLIQWRAKDILGNGYNESDQNRIFIDMSNLTFTNPLPSPEEWQTNQSVTCNITVIDNLSGVNASSIEFRISTAGFFNYGPWQSARETNDANIIHCSVNPTLVEGNNNYIQWRAKDRVGNGPLVSEDYLIKIDINYPPEVTLLSPEDDAILKTLTPELVWSVTDSDGDEPIYYDLYFNTDETKVINFEGSALRVENQIDTKYKIKTPLGDGLTYYWTIMPNDGIVNGICKSGIWHFKIDTTVEIPIVTLVSPINNSNVSTQTPSLTWDVDYSNKKIVSYNVFIDLFSSLNNFTADHKLPSFMPSAPLIRGASYYWTVIPIADTPSGKIQGICESGIWKFTVGYSITNIYELEIELESTNLIVKQGEYISTNVTVTNIGNTVDIIDLDLDEGIIDANIALERLGTPIRLNESESITLKLEIKTFEEIEVKNYTITVTAISNGALAEKQDITASETLRLQIIEKDAEQTQPTDKESDWALWAALIIIAIIIVLALTFFIYRKRQAEKVPVLKAELEYKPPELVELPGITTPAAGAAAKPELPSAAAQAQPQVASGVTPTPALAPTPGQAVPQLPQATLSKAQQLN